MAVIVVLLVSATRIAVGFFPAKVRGANELTLRSHDENHEAVSLRKCER
jgi:hypothetical protein